MGLYLRKSVRVGPFRFNFSNVGVGVSVGIKGLRVGTGPRGNYISVGSGGLSYRASFPATDQSNDTSPARPGPANRQDLNQQPIRGAGAMIDIASGPITAMQDSSSTELLAELNGKHRRPSYWIWAALGGLLVIFLVRNMLAFWALTLTSIVVLAIVAYIAVRDEVAKTSVLAYELDSATEEAFGTLLSNFGRLQNCSKAWRITSSGRVHDSKYHAGAGSLITRISAGFTSGLPPRVKSNIDVAVATAGKTSLYFMPDRILIYAGNQVGALSYSDLEIDVAQKRFIEDGAVPSDARIVDQTWKYVNKKGGPDKRFKNNHQLPVALYEELLFHSRSGLNELFQVSKTEVSDPVKSALKKMALTLPR